MYYGRIFAQSDFLCFHRVLATLLGTSQRETSYRYQSKVCFFFHVLSPVNVALSTARRKRARNRRNGPKCRTTDHDGSSHLCQSISFSSEYISIRLYSSSAIRIQINGQLCGNQVFLGLSKNDWCFRRATSYYLLRYHLEPMRSV